MLSLLSLLACGDPTPTVPAGPDVEATAKVAEAVCKLFQGAGVRCTHQGGSVHAKGHELELAALPTSETQTLGLTNLKLQITLSAEGTPQPALTTPAVAFGGNREEALKRGLHEWAVVYGVALVDWALDDPARPALAALSADAAVAFDVGERPVLRGFSLLRRGRGGGAVDHSLLLPALAPALDSLDHDLHAISIDLTRDPQGQQARCLLDGKPAPALCTAAWTYPWPKDANLQVKQYYVLPALPSGS